MIIIIDNFDSFTYNLVDYFKQLGEEVSVFRNTVEVEALKRIHFSKLIISPGPGRPEDAGNLFPILDYYHNKLPILGICLGHQAIAQFFGCSICKAQMPMHGKVSEIKSTATNQLLEGIPARFEVVRYHSLIAKLNDNSELSSLAETEEGENMIFAHKSLPIYGIQYHPEAALTQFGLKILGNFLKRSNELALV